MTVNQTQASASAASTAPGQGAHSGRAKGAAPGQGAGAMGFLALLTLADGQEEPSDAAASFADLFAADDSQDQDAGGTGKGRRDVPDLVDLAGLLAHTAAAQDAALAGAGSANAAVGGAAGSGAGTALASAVAKADQAARPEGPLQQWVDGVSEAARQAATSASTVVQGGRDAASRLGWIESAPTMSTAGYLSSIGRAADAATLADGGKGASATALAAAGAAAKPRTLAAGTADARGAKVAGTGETLQLAQAATVQAMAQSADGSSSSDTSGAPAERAPLPVATVREGVQERPAFHAETAGVDASAASPEAMQASAEEQLAQQIGYWVTQKTQTAELRLDSVGGQPIEVSISLSGNEAHVEFRSDHAQARELLGNAAPQLADLLRSEGLVLGGVSVGTSGQGRSSSSYQPTASSARPAARRAAEGAEPVALAATTRSPSATSGRALDLFV